MRANLPRYHDEYNLKPLALRGVNENSALLNLYDMVNGYNNAAGLLADKNNFLGIDMVRFGEDISIIQKRAIFEKISLLDVYENSLNVFRDYYQYEEIQRAERNKVERIPEAAFREAIANALIHRAWDVESQIRVLMFDDRIEIVSPGGLTSEITAGKCIFQN